MPKLERDNRSRRGGFPSLWCSQPSLWWVSPCLSGRRIEQSRDNGGPCRCQIDHGLISSKHAMDQGKGYYVHLHANVIDCRKSVLGLDDNSLTRRQLV